MSYKGTSWKKHKYIKKVGKRYFYDIERAIEENEDELLKNVKKKKKEFDNIINERSIEIDKSIEGSLETISEIREKAKNVPEVLKTEEAKNIPEVPKIEKDRIPNIKISPDVIEQGKEIFDKAYKGFRNLNETISDNLINGIHQFNKFLGKYF